MNYLLVTEEQLEGQGYDYQYAERIPDGRIILPLTALKVLSNFAPVVISGDSLKKLIKEQEESGEFDKKEAEPMPEGDAPAGGDEVPSVDVAEQPADDEAPDEDKAAGEEADTATDDTPAIESEETLSDETTTETETESETIDEVVVDNTAEEEE